MDTPTIEKRAPRAVRNNNPGNIRVGDPWQGLMDASAMTPDQATEHDFCVFQSPKWGFRALARVLISYQDKYGINTIGEVRDALGNVKSTGVIGRWAPPAENDTAAYIKNVSELMLRAPTDALDLHSFKDLRPLCKAIAIHESGAWLFEDADLDAGLTLAGAPPDVPALASSRTIKTAIGSGVVAVPAIVDAVQQIKPAIDTVSQIKEFLPSVALVILLVAVACIAYYRIDDWLHARR